ncbi:hypothetical protein TrST_g7360 [Triparma strigata]|uniref:TANC1/2-like winged helix domain-containing protein n=1 Tax=Triparma strigata TaxID=1606541 RepID=A0A9W7EZ99_9STRA|nr:hypothetical protein TrST_g7360 [Triparma strigata]
MGKPEGDFKSWLLVIDSLDEAALADDKKKSIVGLVTELAESERFPSWLKLLVTSRPQESVTSELKHAKKIDLEAVMEEDKEKNLEDIRAYVDERMMWELKPSEYHRASLALKIVGNNKRLKINLATTLGTKNVRDYVEAVVDKSEGMFLYARTSPGLSGFHEGRFKDMGFGETGSEKGRWYDEEIAPVLEVIVASQKPPTESFLLQATGLQERRLKGAIAVISTFLKTEKREDEEPHYTFMHQSFNNWITNRFGKNKSFAVEKEKGHTAIAKAFVRILDENDSDEKKGVEGYWKMYGVYHVAENVDGCKEILKKEEEVLNFAGDGLRTVLYCAALLGRDEIVKLLLKHEKIDVNQGKKNGATPLYVASKNGHSAVVELLLKQEKIDVNQAAKDGATPLFMASQEGHLAVVELLLKQEKIEVNQVRSNGTTPLYFTSRNGHSAVVDKLLSKGADATLRSGSMTPLQIAEQQNHTEVVGIINSHTTSNA